MQVEGDTRMMVWQHMRSCTNLSQGLVEIIIRSHGFSMN